MTDDQHGQGAQGASGGPQSGGRWDPLPQGEYDDGATAFVKLPEGGIDALLAGDSPLAAPGHGYVPPQITVAPATTAGTDPAATGTWSMPGVPQDGGNTGQGEIGTAWPDPNAGVPQDSAGDRFTYQPGATGQWTYEEPVPAPGQHVTGEWSIPVAGGDLPDESGEFTTSALAQQWGSAPATLPGGAPAPWATQSAGTPWGQPEAAGEEPRPTAAETPYGSQETPAEAPQPPEADQPAPETPAAPEAASLEGADSDAADGDNTDAQESPAGQPQDAAEAPGAPETGPGPEAPAQEADGADRAVSETGETESEEAAAEQAEDAEAPLTAHEEHPLVSYVLRVNGVDRPVPDAWIGESLLYVLRERLGLAGAKDGCSQGECGACNVQVDGRLVASCLVPAVTAAGSEVRTVEGLAADGQPSDVQRALARCGAVQCGFCVPGMAMTVHDLLEGNPAPTELETRQALCGNLCRCSGYRGVLEAVKEVVAEREAHAAADAETDGDEARIPHQAGPGAGGVHPSVFEAPGAMDPVPQHRAHGDGTHAYGDPGPGYGPGQGQEQDGGQA
ncbi:2Fe-2S iron-sulfur cluster-binding protein [Streptomyces sp. NPDC057386]|uniref:2Fe-2S iron-sulfur cluster-binding protein n=1 Tax=unclassified Streptomyces TaxID=2593676 RepID=UPI00362D43F1